MAGSVDPPDSHPQSEVTRLLQDWCSGRRAALDALMPLVHRELRQLAASYMRRERPGHTLQVTALVNEAYLKLVDQTQVDWRNRSHFFGIAAQCMRRILVDHARQRLAQKRGGAEAPIALDDTVDIANVDGLDILAVDEALERLARLDARQARVVELRYFTGLSIAETAEALGVSTATVKREWGTARLWLTHALARL